MAKYEIELYYTTHCTVVVEADNEEAAIEEAWMEAAKGEYDEQICVNCVHDFVGDVKLVEEECYTVWVGGVEVNDYYLTRILAEKLAQSYRDEGFDDVVVEKIEGNE